MLVSQRKRIVLDVSKSRKYQAVLVTELLRIVSSYSRLPSRLDTLLLMLLIKVIFCPFHFENLLSKAGLLRIVILMDSETGARRRD